MSPPAREPSAAARAALLDWYRPRGAAYPWRSPDPDPWQVLVSEVMLQQTQAARVAAAYGPFLRRFPTPAALGAASRADVLRAWGALGYHRRAVALQEAARAIVRGHGGRVPAAVADLRALPGVGEYTAAAVASVAFGEPVAAVDTNVRRIWARVVHAAEPDEVAPARLRDDAQAWLDERDPAAWNQAVMDLGRVRCRPAPRCGDCPIRSWCGFAAAGKTGRPSVRRQAPFEGSTRQVRGAVVAHLRDRSPSTVGAVATSTGHEHDRVVEAIRGLARDGIVDASDAALAGRPRARVRLPA